MTTFDWSLYRGNLAWLPSHTHYLARHGSWAYGTNTPESDEDFRGVAIAPREYQLGALHTFEQAVCNDPDLTVFEARKFVSLAAQCNPNVIEILFVADADRLQVSPLGERILGMRDLFITKRVRHTFSGYAASQMSRIKRHYSWLKHPPKAKPTRAEHGLPEHTLVPRDHLQAAEAAIRAKLDRWSADYLDGLDSATRIAVTNRFAEHLAELSVASKEDLWPAAARTLGMSDNLIEAMKRERAYEGAKREWDNYEHWKKTRNPKRADLEAKHGFDCYLDDTEFLTESGWKRYDEISKERLATLNPESGMMEFQTPTERIEKRYSGAIHFWENRYSACAVTANHRMWVSRLRRNPKNKFSTAYRESAADWAFAKSEDLLVGRHGHYHMRSASDGAADPIPIARDVLIAVGAFVSEGYVCKRNKAGPSVLRVSQKTGGRLVPYMDELCTLRAVRRYEYERKNRARPCREISWTLADPELAKSVALWCGEGSVTKRLPPWIIWLSKQDARLLLDVLVAGDGTARKHSLVYYTASRELADDMQTLAIVAGYTSQIWGPYPNRGNRPMFHVYLADRAVSHVVTRGSGAHVLHEQVTDRRIVCFTVPNEILVTRRGGKVAIQGNTKHAMHLVRLLRMCREILTTGKVLVKRPDAAELLEIRNGAWTYAQLVEWAENEDKALQEVAAQSKLPKAPDVERIDSELVAIVSEAIR